MNSVRLTLILLIAALAVNLAVTRPSLRARTVTSEEYNKLRKAQAAQRRQLERATRYQREATRALQTLAAAASPSLPAVRQRVLGRLSGLAVSDVQLDVRPARAPAFAEVKVMAEGSFFDLVALTSRLARPDTGLVLKSVALRRSDRDARVKLSVTAESIGVRP